MAKTWILDTETKGTGAHMVPLEKALKKPSPEQELAVVELGAPAPAHRGAGRAAGGPDVQDRRSTRVWSSSPTKTASKSIAGVMGGEHSGCDEGTRDVLIESALWDPTNIAQTGQQLLLGAYQALERQVGLGTVRMYARHEMQELVVIDGKARGIVTRDLETGQIESWAADAVILATGGYGTVFYLATYAKGANTTAIWRAYKKGAAFGNPCYTQIHPTCIPVTGEHQSKLTLMSESLRNDGRIWVPKAKGDRRPPNQIPEDERDYYLERKYPSYGNLAPRDIASRAAKQVCDEGRGVGKTGLGVYLDFADAIKRLGVATIRERYGNLFDMYERITDEDPYKAPMRIYPAIHYVMGGLWVDYNLMSTLQGLFVLGEANFSDHGANRLAPARSMQGLADGYFIIPYTLGNYLATSKPVKVATDHAAFKEAEAAVDARLKRLLGINGRRTVDTFHRTLGKVLWDLCGMARNEDGLKTALEKIPALRQEFWEDVRVLGDGQEVNQSLEKAGRVADFLELGELLCRDALERRESCGAHFREEFQTPDGEAARRR